MIAPAIVEEVRRLLAEGALSQRKIAKLMKISRGTAGAIARGKRPDYPTSPRLENDPCEPIGPPQRCAGCGGMVQMPCRTCHARAAKARATKPLFPAWLRQLDEPLGLDLREEHRRRYEEVCIARSAAAQTALQSSDPEEEIDVEPWDIEFDGIDITDEADFGSPDFWDELQVTAV